MKEEKQVRDKANIYAFLAWVLGIIGFILVYCVRFDDDFAMFHAKQSLILVFINIIVLVLNRIFSIAPGIDILMRVLMTLVYALSILISLAGAFFSLKGIRYEFPILYRYSQKLSI